MLHPGLHQSDVVSQCSFSWYTWVPSVISLFQSLFSHLLFICTALFSTAVVQRPSGKKVFTVMLSLTKAYLLLTFISLLFFPPPSPCKAQKPTHQMMH